MNAAPTYPPIHLTFVTFTGPTVEVAIDIGSEEVIDFSRLDERLILVKSGFVMGVKGGFTYELAPVGVRTAD
jgi:hypothetical protein